MRCFYTPIVSARWRSREGARRHKIWRWRLEFVSFVRTCGRARRRLYWNAHEGSARRVGSRVAWTTLLWNIKRAVVSSSRLRPGSPFSILYLRPSFARVLHLPARFAYWGRCMTARASRVNPSARRKMHSARLTIAGRTSVVNAHKRRIRALACLWTNCPREHDRRHWKTDDSNKRRGSIGRPIQSESQTHVTDE